jgi:hypothetical protein
MQDLSKYINNELAEESAKLSIKDNTGVLHSCSTNGPQLEGGNTPLYTSKLMLLPALPCLEQQSRITGQSSAVRSAEQSWTADSSTSLHGIHISRFLSIRLRLVKAKTKKGRLSIKKNLTLEEIGPVASSLLMDDSIPFFVNNYDLICDVWIFFLSARARERSAADAVVAAFDVLYRLIDMRDTKFLLRFAYVQLADAIDTLVNAVSTERCASHIHQGPSYRDV